MTATGRTLKKAPPEPAATKVVPLADITITWTPQRRFAMSDKPTTITGRQLAIALQLLSTIHPSGDWDKLGDPEDIALEAEGLSDIANLLGCVDDYQGGMAGGVKGAFWSLSRRMRELAGMADATLLAPTIAESASVTIASRGEAA